MIGAGQKSPKYDEKVLKVGQVFLRQRARPLPLVGAFDLATAPCLNRRTQLRRADFFR
jgi:hypothetical protein